MFGLDSEEVIKICKSIVNKESELLGNKMTRDLLKSVASMLDNGLGKEVNELTKKFGLIQDNSVVTADEQAKLSKKVEQLAQATTSLSDFVKRLTNDVSKASSVTDFVKKSVDDIIAAAKTDISANLERANAVTQMAQTSVTNADEYIKRVAKLAGTFERVMAMVENGEQARLEVVKQMVKHGETTNQQLKETLNRMDTAMAKLIYLQEESMGMQKLLLNSLKEFTTSFMSAVSVGDEEPAVKATTKKKAVRK